MTARRAAVLAVMVALLAGAGVAMWRSLGRPAGDPAERLAAGLRCPACQGESVADSRSPVAAAMRAAIAAQLRDGRTPEQVRAWLVQRYGPEVLATPPASGIGALLWAVPAAALVTGVAVAARTARRGCRPAGSAAAAGGATASDHGIARDAGTDNDQGTARDRGTGRGQGTARGRGTLPPTVDSGTARRRAGRRARRIADVAAVCLIGSVAAVALASPRPAPAPAGASSAGPPTAELALARSMEEQGRYAAAAEAYREALRRRPSDDLRLRLAFTLIRAGRPADAQTVARQVLAVRPDDPEALLMLGLAERDMRSAEAAPTLRRFLDLAPYHPAAAEIRRLLAPG
jgi:cytochrome c-type biogenesis protein CcmH/NrfF